MNSKSISIVLPSEVIRTLSRAEIYVADLILDLCRCTAKNSPSKAMYSCVRQKWLAERVGVSREWISKCVNKLNRLLIIDVKRRRKVGGRWKTNIYRVGALLKMGYKQVKKRFFNVFNHVKSNAHIVYKNKPSSTTIRKRGFIIKNKADSLLETESTFEEVIARCKQRLENMPD